MPIAPGALLEAIQLLLRASHLARPDDVPPLVSGAARILGAVDASVYVIDYDQVVLVPFLGMQPGDAGASLQVDATLAGRTYRDVAQHIGTAGEHTSLWTPLVDGTDRLGVIEFRFPAGTELDADDQTMCRDVAAAVGELLVTRTVYGDAIERARRASPLTIPAEVQWKLLPPLTFVSPNVAFAGALAPATEVAGDSFDYAVNGDVAYAGIFDAMGHGLEATLLATVAVGAYRNARRSGLTLGDTVSVIDAEIASQFGPDKFVTGIVGELDTRTGVWTWITCGHPPALIVRGGHVVKTLDAIVNAPLGLSMLRGEPRMASERLEPGDRLLLYTDGVVEARSPDGEFFGIDRLVDFITREAAAGHPAAEAMRRLNLSILAHQEGGLQDDATTVMVEWLSEEVVRSTP